MILVCHVRGLCVDKTSTKRQTRSKSTVLVDTFRVKIQGNASKIYALPAATARTRERPDGTLMQFDRLRPVRE